MSRRSSKKAPAANNTKFYVAGGVVLLIIVAVALFLPRNAPTGAASSLISPADYTARFINADTPHLLIDVRTPAEFASGHIAGAVNIPVESLQSRLSEVPNGQPIVVYCRSGNRSAQAASILASAGYENLYDLGGITAWTAQGFPVE